MLALLLLGAPPPLAPAAEDAAMPLFARAVLAAHFPADRLLVTFTQHRGDSQLIEPSSRLVMLFSDWGPLRQPSAAEYTLERAHGYLLSARGASAFSDQVSVLRRLPSWNATARFLATLPLPLPAVDRRQLLALFNLFRSLYITNLVIGVPDGAGAVDVYTAFPYLDRSGFCGRGELGITRLDKWSASERRFLQGAVLFPDKLPGPKLGGCLVRTLMTAGRLPPRVLLELAEQLDMSLVVEDADPDPRTAGDEIRPIRGAWGGQFGLLQRRRGDVLLLKLPTSDRVRDFTTTQPVVFVRVDVHLRCQMRSEPKYHILDQIWLPVLLAATVSLYFVVALAAHRLQVLSGQTAAPRPSLARGLYELWSVLMETPVRDTFMPRNFRFVYLVVVFGLFIINNLVKSTITAELATGRAGDFVKTLAELSHRGGSIGFPFPIVLDNMRRAVRDSPELADLVHRSHPCVDNLTDCLQRFKADNHSSYGFTTSRLSMYSTLTALGVCIYTMREPIEVAPVTLFTRKDDPLGVLLDTALAHMHAAGLPYRWLEELTPHVLWVEDATTSSHPVDNGEDWHQVVTALQCCAIGLSSATVVFIWERVRSDNSLSGISRV